jgi:RNA polymerase sigma factor (sigma-70 family)
MTTPTEPSDEELMASYVDGDVRAFETLFQRYASRLHGFFTRLTKDGALADDLVQTTFLKLHGARQSYDRTRPLRPWIYAIAARARVDVIRQRMRQEGRWDDELDGVAGGTGDGPERTAEAREGVVQLEVALQKLPDGQRTVLLLHRIEGLSFAEIAEVLSASEGTALTEVAVRVRAFRAVAALRAQMTEHAQVEA